MKRGRQWWFEKFRTCFFVWSIVFVSTFVKCVLVCTFGFVKTFFVKWYFWKTLVDWFRDIPQVWHSFWDGCFWILILFSHLTLLVFRWKNFLTFIVLLCPIRLFHAYPYPFKGKWNPLKNLCSVNCILFPCFFCLILVAVFAFQFTFLSVPFNLRT